MPIFENNTFPVINTGTRHVACVVLVDTSGSMAGNSIVEVNNGLQELKTSLENDATASGSVEICVIEFNSSCDMVHPFAPVPMFNPPSLNASGLTSLNQAIIKGLDEVQRRKDLYKAEGVPYYRPWMFLLTDGAATDTEFEAEAKAKLLDAVDQGKVLFFACGVTDADFNALAGYKCHKGTVLKAQGTDFGAIFEWLSSSVAVVSGSRADSKIDLPPLPPQISIVC